MTSAATSFPVLSLVERSVLCDGRPVVTQLGSELETSGAAEGPGLFLEARASQTSSRHVFQLGSIPDLQRFTSCHRYEPFWMKPKAGATLSEVQEETQYLLAELSGGTYLLLVPLIDATFRFALRGNDRGQLELVAETNDARTAGSGGLSLYVAAGSDPFALARAGARAVMTRLGGGKLRQEKALPGFVDEFGWCTWDAFYQEVSADKLREGLESFSRGGVRPRMIILDDGWQSVERMPTGETRLTAFAPNEKFGGDLRSTVRLCKDEYGVTTFLVWHAVCGYWGGADGARLPGYGIVEQARHFGAGILRHEPYHDEVWWGALVGLVPAESIERFYDDYHCLLAEQGVDGVKVDNQAVLEGLAQGQGGRVALNRAYRKALEGSVARHFQGRLINCMSNAQETWYGGETSTLLRSSIDFFPTRPETHGLHLYTNAQVGLWFGEFMHPDWDMFQSGHAWGAYHAAGRAVSGGPVYVSDKPGQHDFDLLQKLVCSDGSVLRCDQPGLPTLDTLFRDPTREDVLLKIWNRQGAAGIVGVFHARTGPEVAPESNPERTLCGSVGPSDVPDLEGERFVAYAQGSKKLELLAPGERREVRLGHGGSELFTFVPAHRFCEPIGLADKLNVAGGIESSTWPSEDRCQIDLRDGGELVLWSERRPSEIDVAGSAVPFEYDAGSGTLRVHVEQPGRKRVTLRWTP